MYYANPSTLSLSAPVISRAASIIEGADGAKVSGEAEYYLTELKGRLAILETQHDYDADLMGYLRTAIDAVENYTRLALQPQTVTVRYESYSGSPLPYGPVLETPEPVITPRLTDGSTVSVTLSGTGALSGGSFPSVIDYFQAGTVAYTAGYSRAADADFPVPPALIGAILEHAAAAFRAGGVSGGKVETYWKTLAAPFRKYN